MDKKRIKKVGSRSLGEAFRGESQFKSEQKKATLEEAFQEAAIQAAGNYPENTRFDVTIDVKIRKDNQNVKVYGVNLTPKG